MPVPPIYTRRPAKKARTPELDDAESQQYSPYPRFSRCSAGPTPRVGLCSRGFQAIAAICSVKQGTLQRCNLCLARDDLLR